MFLQRFVNEISQYISGMLAMTLPPPSLPPWAEQFQSERQREQREAEEDEEERREELEAARTAAANVSGMEAVRAATTSEKPSYVSPTGTVIGPDGQVWV